MQFEIEVYQNEAGEWIATAVQHGVSARGASAKDALARVMEALAAHFKSAAHPR